MSSKKEITKNIVALLKTLPKDRLERYSSFKGTQLARFQDSAKVESMSERDLQLQYLALRDMVNDKYKNYYRLSDKLLKPKGNPEYYDRLLSELKGEKKETFLTAVRTVVFGR